MVHHSEVGSVEAAAVPANDVKEVVVEVKKSVKQGKSALLHVAAHGPHARLVQLFSQEGRWHVKGEDIDFGKKTVIGKGSICTVLKAKFAKKDVAVKVLRMEEDPDEGPQPAMKSCSVDFEQEFNVVSREFVHPNVIKFVGAGLTHLNAMTTPVLLYEYVGGGSIESLFERKTHDRDGKPWIPARTLSFSWCQQLCTAVAYLHSFNIPFAHRDIKPANVLVTKDHKTVKLADFSLATPLRESGSDFSHIPSVAGSLRYMAPEVAFKAPFQLDKSDMYSAALTCWFMIFAQRPFHEHEPRMALCLATQGMRPMVPPKDVELSMVLHLAWEISPQKRPAAHALAQEFGMLLDRAKNPESWASRFASKLKSLRASDSWKSNASTAKSLAQDAMDAGEDMFIRSHLQQPKSLRTSDSWKSNASTAKSLAQDAMEAGEDLFIRSHLREPKPHTSLPHIARFPSAPASISTGWKRLPPGIADKSFSMSFSASSVGNGRVESRLESLDESLSTRSSASTLSTGVLKPRPPPPRLKKRTGLN